MNADRVRSMIARTLGVGEQHIGNWLLEAASNDQAMSIVGAQGRFASGRLVARLSVSVFADDKTLRKMENHLEHAGWPCQLISRYQYNYQSDSTGPAEVKLVLGYGRNTEHLFKACYQTFTVRGPQTKKQQRRKK